MDRVSAGGGLGEYYSEADTRVPRPDSLFYPQPQIVDGLGAFSPVSTNAI
jgi:hypothetical protein